MASSTNTSYLHTPTLPPTLTTTTHFLTPTTLNRSPHLPALFTLINKCFNIGHNPPGHSYLRCYSERETVYIPPKQQQMARGQNPYSSVNLERIESWKSTKRCPKWEVLVMVVEPELQGRGISGQLMGMTVEEIKRRCVTQIQKGKESGKAMLMLSSMQELNETYYAKRGWTTTGVTRFQPGTMGRRDGFGVVEMMKIVDLQEMRFL
ncbi:hypothetical protein ABVK25_009790 [Lepraria finkii]|uniref:N-acetyltransferase domain-containing protein n=1 Tax=Lepraria finkii TaxID=1340010 RepID=A0ABR4AXR3_9LECA